MLCSQRGDYINGECQCNPGWKGKECSLRHDECEVADCNGHGHCVSGKCQCVRGYKGKFCEEGMLINGRMPVEGLFIERFFIAVRWSERPVEVVELNWSSVQAAFQMNIPWFVIKKTAGLCAI